MRVINMRAKAKKFNMVIRTKWVKKPYNVF